VENFDSAYEGRLPWDIGQVQPVFKSLKKNGEIRGSVLDIGCGTGENVLYLAIHGHEAWGIDASPNAIKTAKTKAEQRHLHAIFRVFDAFDLKNLDKKFDTVIDSGLFHTFEDEERPFFVSSLKSILKSGGQYFMLVMSDREPDNWGGPKRITKEDIRRTFDNGWRINYIREAKFETMLKFHTKGAKAWLASITKL
jgi:cyclopropane fatty-acyl-phospholipid synthase-like methyltransferase